MLVTVNETNKVANDTIDKLNCQSEQFNNIQNNLKETNISLSRSSKTISSLKSTFGLSFSSQQNDKFILPKNKKQKSNDVVSHQQDIIEEENNDMLTELCKSLSLLHNKSIQIGNQLESHNDKLNNIDTNVVNTTTKLKNQIVNIKSIS